MDLQCKHSITFIFRNIKTNTILMALYRFITSNIFNISIVYI